MSLIAVPFKKLLDNLLPISTTFALWPKREKVVVNGRPVKIGDNLEDVSFTCCTILVRPPTIIRER